MGNVTADLSDRLLCVTGTHQEHLHPGACGPWQDHNVRPPHRLKRPHSPAPGGGAALPGQPGR